MSQLQQDSPHCDFKGRLRVLATPEAIDFIEREGKRITHTYAVKDGRLVPELTVEDWQESTDSEKLSKH